MQSVEDGDNANGWQVGLTHEHVIHKNKADDMCEVLIQHSQIQYIFGSKTCYHFMTLNTFQKEKQNKSLYNKLKRNIYNSHKVLML